MNWCGIFLLFADGKKLEFLLRLVYALIWVKILPIWIHTYRTNAPITLFFVFFQLILYKYLLELQ